MLAYSEKNKYPGVSSFAGQQNAHSSVQRLLPQYWPTKRTCMVALWPQMLPWVAIQRGPACDSPRVADGIQWHYCLLRSNTGSLGRGPSEDLATQGIAKYTGPSRIRCGPSKILRPIRDTDLELPYPCWIVIGGRKISTQHQRMSRSSLQAHMACIGIATYTCALQGD